MFVGMCPRVLLVSALLSCCTGDSPVSDPPERVHDPHKVVAFAGGNITLPCFVENPDGGDFPTVEWSKDGLKPKFVFLFRDGCETHEMKNPAFEHRTSFVMKKLKDGDVSLRLSDVQLTDAGTYQCMKIWQKPRRNITTVELEVVSLSDPELSVVSPESGGVTLQCEAPCWHPQPVIKFLDDQGNNIHTKEQITHKEDHGCFTVRRSVTLTTNTRSVTCRAELESNMSRSTKILIPVDCLRTGSCTTAMAVVWAAVGAVAVTFTALVCGAVVLLWRKCGKTADNQKPMNRDGSADSTTSNASENQFLLRDQTSTEPHQTRRPDQAQSAQSDHERPPLQRQNSITTSAPPPAAAALVSFSSAAASKKHPGLINRSLSFSDPSHPRTLRRSSSVSNNGYSPLTHVNEESEP